MMSYETYKNENIFKENEKKREWLLSRKLVIRASLIELSHAFIYGHMLDFLPLNYIFNLEFSASCRIRSKQTVEHIHHQNPYKQKHYSCTLDEKQKHYTAN